ncbi:hypothetical protein [Streptomyces sp. NRRL B-24484]|uniref:hypothetical protein n=1 Tax=Streptomyces sp. NRRL B-24484 TaxID=1463833 RepID=UPI0004C129EA|nr:hypothetical protein [Streptomyces sp. NRRL B-24484]
MKVDRRALDREPSRPDGYWITVVGRYPDVPGHFTDRRRPRIAFNLSRPLDTLARDIRRRFLPEFLAAHERAVNELHARAVAGGRREDLALSLLARFPNGGWHGESRSGHHETYVDLEPSGGAYAHVEMHGAEETVSVQLHRVRPQDLEVLWDLFEARARDRSAKTAPDSAALLDNGLFA